jgi:hypothetical protein
MLLPPRLLELHEANGRILPRWLGPRDEGWVSDLIDVTDELGGRPAGEADDVFRSRVFAIAARHGVPVRVVALAFWVEQRRFASRVEAPVPPERARDVVFELAATMARDDALAAAAASLGVSADDVERSLFADRRAARILVAPPLRATPRDLIDRCNVAVLQALLVRATEVTAVLRADVAPLVSYAKRLGLIASFDVDGGATRACLSGPLSVFHDTTKYGRALASFVPYLASARAWQLSARVVLPTGAALLELDTQGPFGAPGPMLDPAPDPRAARLARDLRRLGSEFEAASTDAIVRTKHRVLFPDLALVSARGRVLVDVVSYWTPSFLAQIVTAAHEASVPVVVCVDEARGSTSLADIAGVVPFRGVIGAASLASAAERALARWLRGGASWPPAPASREDPRAATAREARARP